VFAALLQALVEPARQLGVPSLPRRLLDVVASDRVGGRRAWANGGRAAVEVNGVNRPDSSGYVGQLQTALERLPGVEWARVNAPLGRVVVGLSADPAPLSQLVAVVSDVEDAAGIRRGAGAADPPRAEGSLPDGRRRGVPVGARVAGSGAVMGGPLGPAVERATVALAADLLGIGVAVTSRVVTLGALPVELASVVTAVDTVPRLRAVVEGMLGRPTADTTLAVANAAAQGLAQGFLGLAVDAAYRVLALREVTANSAAWRRQEGLFFATAETAGADPMVVRRPARLAPGPVERWANTAGLVAVTAFAVGLPSTGDLQRAAGLALAALPKAARLGREGFATEVGRVLARRGAVVMDPGALRRLDRVTTVVLDADVLITGQHLLGAVAPLSGADPAEVAERLHAMFRGADSCTPVVDGSWQLGPVDELGLVGRRGVAQRRQLESSHPSAVVGLARGNRLMAVAAVVPEPSESLEALAAACHRAGRRLVVAGAPTAVGSTFADAVLPGGGRLLDTVRGLQVGGGGLLLLSRRAEALANADVGIGVSGGDAGNTPPWGAHVLIGGDLSLAALLIDGCGTAAAVSHRSVALAQAGTALGAVAATATGASAVAPRSLLAVNAAAAVSLAQGVWAARELVGRPLTPPISRVPWHAMPAAVVLERLGATPEGLGSVEVRRRQRRSAEPGPASTSLLSAVVDELSNPLTPILAGGAALSAAIGSVVDAALVAGVTLASAVIGGIQRRGTARALTSLLIASAVTARVRRDGQEQTLPADQLVPGDVVLLASGEVVPADCRVLEVRDLEVDESSLTGEPFPVAKTAAPLIADTVAERTCMLYEGTTIAAGRGVVVVVATGSATEAGRSMAATRVGAAAGGVEARLARITTVTVPITLGAAVAVIAAGLARGRTIAATAGAGVSLAVAAVPEGLPFLVSAAQLAAARRLSLLGALVRNPRIIEALGRVDVLCFDKTGTLTEGRIALAAVADADGVQVPVDQLGQGSRVILAAGLRATPEPRRGQDLSHLTDRAVATGARAAGVTRAVGLPGWARLAALPFEPSRGYHATLGHAEHGGVLSVKGAPETVLSRSSTLRRGERELPLDQEQRRRLTDQIEHLAGQGYRVLAVAERPAATGESIEEEHVGGLSLLGFLALTDPVRPAASASIEALREAGVQIVMITGDHPSTAAAIARRLDLLREGRVITGTELGALDDDALDQVLPAVTVVARGTPAHKVRVVQAFQRLHRTVAMTGDGTNDAPAIRLADVGIALGHRGTPAARAAADLVVTDDRLETIISALIEGRAMWGSVRKALGILVGGNLGEIAFTVLGAALTGVSPLGTRQLLLVNLLTDLAPALAVALRPPHADSAAALLAEGPEASLGAALTRDVGIRAAATTAGAAAAWLFATATGYGAAAQTVALTALVGAQLGQTLAAGGLSRGVVASAVGSAAALALVVQNPVLSAFFGSTPLGLGGWVIAVAASAAATALAAAAPQLLQSLNRQIGASRAPSSEPGTPLLAAAVGVPAAA